MADIETVKPATPTLPARRIEKGEQHREKDKPRHPPQTPHRERGRNGDDEPQIDEYA